GICLEILGAIAHERFVHRVLFEQRLAETLQEGDIAVDPDLQEQIGQLGRPPERLLRMLEREQPGLAERVDADDARACPLRRPDGWQSASSGCARLWSHWATRTKAWSQPSGA